MGLRLGTTDGQYGQATPAGVGGSGAEQGGLPLAGVAHDGQRLPAHRDAVERLADFAQLLVSPDQPRWPGIVRAHAPPSPGSGEPLKRGGMEAHKDMLTVANRARRASRFGTATTRSYRTIGLIC